ncbi:MAG: site-specific DNA-methyltransferase [Clostridia bacterium]|nr:site-specific DNA-methyltransferase [Clostridia bacterium]
MNEYLKITNENNLDLMKRYEDNYFDLAIVDPPYGINISSAGGYYHIKGKGQANPHTKKAWDNETPPQEYWNELFRVSKNQIVWGGNYMTDFLKPSRCWIFWDKMKSVDNYADGELAWTSFDRNTKKVQIQHNGFLTKDKGSAIHPTQKPAMLYGWIINNFCEKGFKLLDTHLGSGSIALAVDSANKIEKMELELVACELDEEYYTKAINRIENETNWNSLF